MLNRDCKKLLVLFIIGTFIILFDLLGAYIYEGLYINYSILVFGVFLTVPFLAKCVSYLPGKIDGSKSDKVNYSKLSVILFNIAMSIIPFTFAVYSIGEGSVLDITPHYDYDPVMMKNSPSLYWFLISVYCFIGALFFGLGLYGVYIRMSKKA